MPQVKIISSALAASAVHKSQYPAEPLAQIALIGRSNSGKSSLINALLQRKNLARTSSQPGKTRLLNFYRAEAALEDERRIAWHFVDLPGYGYAKAAKTEREQWAAFIDAYLRSRRQTAYCWQLLDIRHLPSQEDRQMYRFLSREGFRLQLIAAKSDKLSKSAAAAGVKSIAEALETPVAAVLPFSAVTLAGREELLSRAAAFVVSLGG
ncbi:MAG: ribosome biogenesis GTP-binding protein YihA/YsxC [Firmicutes bacterium]|nr:ribosome biogenesis GTP-binding protein YihA/YsxC [Bacillota bacterium]